MFLNPLVLLFFSKYWGGGKYIMAPPNQIIGGAMARPCCMGGAIGGGPYRAPHAAGTSHGRSEIKVAISTIGRRQDA